MNASSGKRLVGLMGIGILVWVVVYWGLGLQPFRPEVLGGIDWPASDSVTSRILSAPESLLLPPTCVGCTLLHEPGFVVCYSPARKQASWVAYVLEPTDFSPQPDQDRARGAGFRPHPGLPVGLQATASDYRRSGYHRGHLVPAADLTAMPNALAASYRYTNVCPQLAAFNTGVWAELETAVRAWSLRHKRLWVVTGPVPDTVSSRGIGPGKVPVPASFFKCVVDIHPPRLAAVAFVLPNAASTQPFNAYRLSVSELERQLGYPLLRPLPDSLEQALSERMNLQHWTHGQ